MAYLQFLDHIDPGQGGSAMVIPSYNWYRIPIKPEVYPCSQCKSVFSTYDEWFAHRFHLHPIRRPMLILGHREVMGPRLVVMNTSDLTEVRSVNAAACTFNGVETDVSQLPKLLGSQTNGFYEIHLLGTRENVVSKYEISVEIASEEHLRSVEAEFGKLAATGVLTVQGINAFIQSACLAKTAKRYTDGLANYLFGLLGKDQRGDTGLTQDQGLAKLNESHQTLEQLDRPLARVVCAIIEFQLNSFSKRNGLQSVPKLLQAIDWFDSCRTGSIDLPSGVHIPESSASPRVPLDAATNELIDWCSASRDVLVERIKHIVKRTKQPDWLPTDRIKAQVLLAAIYNHMGSHKLSIEIARGFRHDAVFKDMSENLIAAGSSGV